MKIAVLISTYNGEKYLRKQLDSIIRQKGCDVEIYIRDDGSKDSTMQILDEYKAKGLIQVYHESNSNNLGPAKSFLYMLHNIKGYQYYAFSDQDDLWDSDKLEIAIHSLESIQKPALYCCNARIIDENDNTNGEFAYRKKNSITLANEVCMGGALGCTMVMNSQLASIIQSNSIPSKMIMHDCFIQAVCGAIGGKTIFDMKSHMGYRQHGANVVGVKTGKLNGLKYRINFLLSPRKVSIADQCQEILDLYHESIPLKNIEFLQMVANYKTNTIKRIKLSLNKDLYIQGIDNIFIRLSLLLGKR